MLENGPYLIAQVENTRVALPCVDVQEVLQMPRTSAVPSTPSHVRGVINLRGQVLPLLDLRLLFNLRCLHEEQAELERTLEARAEDHRRWLKELELSLLENRPFKLARNPHACAFGKWYDTFHINNDTLTFQQFWRSFDAPHQRIHQIADVALQLAERGDRDGAMKIIERTRSGDLSSLLRLFGSAGNLLRESSRELAIVLRQNGAAVAVSVDKVQCVCKILPTQIEPLPQAMSLNASLTTHTAKIPGTELCLLLDTTQLVEQRVA